MRPGIGLGEAWRLWSAGDQVQQYVLWGQSILWWGRFGKLAQFAAGLVVVLDLIGPERLRAWARGSGELIRRRLRHLRLLSTTRAWQDFLNEGWRGGPVGRGLSRSARAPLVMAQVEAHKEFATAYRTNDWVQIALSALVGIGFCILVAVQDVGDWLLQRIVDHPWLLAFLPLVVVPGLLFYLVTLALSFIRAGLGQALRPLAWLLDRGDPGHPIRWFALVLFAIGFHFDLLAS